PRAADHRGVMHRPIHELSAAYRRGDLTPVAVAEDYLARIGAFDGKVGAYLTVVREQALAAARESELRWRGGSPRGPLDGAPIALKDVLCTAGVRTTAGSRMLERFVPPYDATIVERLRAAGAVVLGKTNLDEFAMGSSTEHYAVPPTRRMSRTPRSCSAWWPATTGATPRRSRRPCPTTRRSSPRASPGSRSGSRMSTSSTGWTRTSSGRCGRRSRCCRGSAPASSAS